VAKEIGAVYVLYSSPTLHDASYNAKTINNSIAASEERTIAKPPTVPGPLAGQTNWRAAMGITRVEDLPDCDHTVW